MDTYRGFVIRKSTRFLITLCFLLSGVFSIRAQVFFSTNPNYLQKKTEGNNLLSSPINAYPDTSINNLHQFTPRDYMGNLALPSPAYELKFGTAESGFRFVDAPNSAYRFSSSDVRYYRSMGPYAEVTGIVGSKKFQTLRALFTHTLKNNLNVTVALNRYSSQGFYINQFTAVSNFYFSANYTHPKQRYGFYAFLLNNSHKNRENGGIRNGTLNDSTVFINKELFEVKLSAASRDNRQWKVMLNPWLRLSRPHDSLAVGGHFLQLKSEWDVSSYRYRDANIVTDNFYRFVFLDSAKTLDSSLVFQINNSLSYAIKSKTGRAGFSAGYKNQINRVWQHLDSVFVNQLLQANWTYTSKSPGDTSGRTAVFADAKADYVFTGPNQGNYKVEACARLFPGRAQKSSFFVQALTESRSPDYIYNFWVSNHFKWLNNGFKAQQQTQVEVGYKRDKLFTASVFYRNMFQFLYFNTNAMPAQLDKTIENLGLRVGAEKLLFKHLGLALHHTYQSTNRTAYVRLPQNITVARVYYGANAFKNNLQFQIGAQAQWYQTFFAYNYMPSTQVYYLQETATTAAMPFVDVYFNARIHPVSFFLKAENVLQGLTGNNYSFVPGYYQPDRAFRFGLTWLFFD